MTSRMDRRHLLRLGGALSILGTAAPFALQLAAVGSAAGQTAADYKALVCVFLVGGNDGHNTVLATDADSFGRYFAARNTGSDPIALMPVGTAATPVGQTSQVTGRTARLTTPESWGGVLLDRSGHRPGCAGRHQARGCADLWAAPLPGPGEDPVRSAPTGDRQQRRSVDPADHQGSVRRQSPRRRSRSYCQRHKCRAASCRSTKSQR